MAFGSNKQRLADLEEQVHQLHRVNGDLNTVVGRADVRLDQYGPALAGLLEDEVTGHDSGRWQSRTDTAYYRIVVNNKPGDSTVTFEATQHQDVPALRRPLVGRHGSDFTEGQLQEFEDWTEWARTGVPVNHGRHAERKVALDNLLS